MRGQVAKREGLRSMGGCMTRTRLKDIDWKLLELHPATTIFPPMGAAEFEALKADIAANGQLVPIEIWEGKVLDGRHRLRACRELGITPKLEQLVRPGSPVEYVMSANFHRRHLTVSQRAMVAARMRYLFDEAAKERRAHRAAAKGTARDRAGAAVGVSGRSVDSAFKVLQGADPEVVRACEMGELAIWTAARLVHLPKEQQRVAMLEGKSGIRSALRDSRPPPSWPDSDRLSKLLESVAVLERGLTERCGSLFEAAGYDRRLTRVHVAELRRLAARLNTLADDGADCAAKPRAGADFAVSTAPPARRSSNGASTNN